MTKGTSWKLVVLIVPRIKFVPYAVVSESNECKTLHESVGIINMKSTLGSDADENATVAHNIHVG